MDDSLAFYAAPGRMTSPGPYAALFEDLPREIGALCHVVQGLMLHAFWAERYGATLPQAREEEAWIRPVEGQLARLLALDPRPLTEARPLDRRLVSNCLGFSVMLTSILRHQGVPARARCGFGRYFLPNHFEDHWVCEYWDALSGQWVLVDSQIDALQREVLHLPFDPLHVPRDAFLVAGQAWQMCRMGQADPETFGIMDMHGLWFVRGNVVRDMASLNKMEMLPWDVWGVIAGRDEDLAAEDWAALDEAAALTAQDDPPFSAVRRFYAGHARWQVPEA